MSEQLGQIDKIDDAAVRTVRISLLILGILAGGPAVASFPDLGLAGAVGTVTLILTLIGAVAVYGTSRVFIGSAPDELAVDYTQRPTVENAYVELLSEYDDGISNNRSTLRANGFILAISRALLVISIIAILWGLINDGPAESSANTAKVTSNALMLIILRAQSRDEMAEAESADRSEEVSQPISIYTGPKVIADAKVAFGEWLEEHGF